MCVKQAGKVLFGGIEEQFKDELFKNRLPVSGAKHLDVRGHSAKMTCDIVSNFAKQKGWKLSRKRIEGMLPQLRVLRSLCCVIVAGTTKRIPSQRPYAYSDTADGRHYAYGACCDGVVTADTRLIATVRRIPRPMVPVVPMLRFCQQVRSWLANNGATS